MKTRRTRSWCFYVIALAISLVSGAPALAAESLCIPLANGLPGSALGGQPPNWWDSSIPQPLYNTALDAPSWRGATGFGYPTGTATTEQVRFRALQRPDAAGNQFLYLSWWGKVVPDVTQPTNALWVGFHDGAAAGAGQDVAIGITLNTTSNQTATTGYVGTILVKPAGSADNAWVSYTGPPAVPAWINGAGAAGTARVWITNPSMWAVEMRIPVTSSTSLNNGIKITAPFKMWYEFRAGTGNVAFPNGYVTYKWPRAALDMDPFLGPRPLVEWGEVRLTNATPEVPDPLCPTDGVSLRAEDIGTTNPNPYEINLASPNTLVARPRNGSLTTDANNVRARFRIANWGTNASWEDVPNPSTTLWTEIAPPGGGPVTILANTQGTITAPYTATQCEACQYQVFYAANTATCNTACPGPPVTNNTKIDHQCMLVELSGPGVNFLNDSAFRNMNFIKTSEFTEVAEVNLRGLPETAPGSLARDVFFYVQALNMPAAMPPGGGARDLRRPAGGYGGHDQKIPPAVYDPNTPFELRRALVSRLLASGGVTYEDLQAVLPTYIVHAYYDTGQRRTSGGNTYAILHPMNSFGYFAMHEGEPEGWAYDLRDAQQIAPNWYRIHVGPTGVATVRPFIEARELRGPGPVDPKFKDPCEFRRGWWQPNIMPGGYCLYQTS